jgi:hypothetical protein
LCNPAFSKCSPEEITRDNTNYLNNKDNLTSDRIYVQTYRVDAIVKTCNDTSG